MPDPIRGPYGSPLLDNFNRADGDPGSNWEAITGLAKPVILSNQLSIASAVSPKGMRWRNLPASVDCEAWGKAKYTVGDLTGPNRLVARLDGATDTCYALRWVVAQEVRLSYYTSGVATDITTSYSTTPGDDFVALTCLGEFIAGWRWSGNAWQCEIVAIDNTITSAGYIGLAISSNTLMPSTFDNFGGGWFPLAPGSKPIFFADLSTESDPLATPSWSALDTDDLKEVHLRTGRRTVKDQTDAGTSAVVFDNSERLYDPSYASTAAVEGTDSLTISGNEITDALRAANVEGDGLSADSSYGIWKAATNYCTNGGLETNATGWGQTLGGGETIARTTAQHKFGVASLSVITNSVTAYLGTSSSNFAVPSASVIYTASGWVKAPAAQAMQIILREYTAADASVGLTIVDFTGTGDWQRVSVLRAFGATGAKGRIYIRTGAAGGNITFYVDGVQIEQAQIATPYKETDGASATRAAARVQAPATLIDETQGWAAFRIRYGFASTALPAANAYLLDWRDDANNLVGLYFDIATSKWTVARKATAGSTAVTAAQTFAKSDKATIIAAWTATGIKVSVNGAAFVSAADANIPALAATLVDLGSQAGASQLNGDVLWSSFGKGTLTDTDAATLYALGDTDPSVGTLPITTLTSSLWPANTASYSLVAASSPLKPLNRLRFRVQVGDTVYPVFSHYVTDWGPNIPGGGNPAEATVQAIDGTDILTRAAATDSRPQELPGARITALLALAGWNSSEQYIGAGQKEIVARTVVAGDLAQSNIKSLIDEASSSEMGYFFFDRDGYAVYHDLHRRLAPPFTHPRYTFSNQPTTGQFDYETIDVAYASDYIENDYVFTMPDGGTVQGSDTDSITAYGRRTGSRSVQLANTLDADSIIAHLLRMNSQPALRVTGLNLVLGADYDLWAAALDIELGDRIRIEYNYPSGIGSTLVFEGHVESRTLDLVGVDARMSFGLSNADQTVYWLYGIPGFSEYGETTYYAP